MTRRDHGRPYPAVLILLLAGLALLRTDLVTRSIGSVSAGLAAGWGPRLHVIFGIILFAAILFLAARALRTASDPAMDGLIVLTASIFGFLAELWGTRSGLWAYYTGEKPPYWIIPAWPIGALVIDRLARGSAGTSGGFFAKIAGNRLYWSLVFLFYCVFIPFLAAGLGAAACLAPAVLTAAALYPGGKDRTGDAAVLLTGAACVFWADLWGTTAGCWSYYTRSSAFGAARGILFGTVFDPVIALAAIKAAAVLAQGIRRLFRLTEPPGGIKERRY
ncbi:MAG: hypothetical protein WCW52_01035 [Elusimicrobiales bacterium]|jgi:hypothetical protein